MFHTLMFPTDASGSASGAVYAATVTGSFRNFDLWGYLSSIEGAALSDYGTFNITLDSSCQIGSNSTASYAFTTGAGWPTGAALTITNDGYIAGRGGDGGANEFDGGDGGNAIVFTLDATLTNNGTIGGGGGGGGAGAAETAPNAGGGGAGLASGVRGGIGAHNGGLYLGGAGSVTGGDGGDLGQPGEAGTFGAGGAAGDAIDCDGFSVTINNNGTISGDIVGVETTIADSPATWVIGSVAPYETQVSGTDPYTLGTTVGFSLLSLAYPAGIESIVNGVTYNLSVEISDGTATSATVELVRINAAATDATTIASAGTTSGWTTFSTTWVGDLSTNPTHIKLGLRAQTPFGSNVQIRNLLFTKST